MDHVVPVALGGSDEPSNLVTACFDCNIGKSAVAPDQALVEDVSEEAAKWGAAMKLAAELHRAENGPRREFVEAAAAVWDKWHVEGSDRFVPKEPAWRDSLAKFYDLGLDIETVSELMDMSMNKTKVNVDGKWSYFCGAAWKTLKARQEVAAGLIEANDPRLAWLVGRIPDEQKVA